MRFPAVCLLVVGSFGSRVLPAQSHGGDLLRQGREELAARHLEAADSLLRAALDTANHLSDIDRQGAYVWLGITEYYRSGDSLARAAFHEALTLNPDIQVGGLSGLDPHLSDLFEQERQVVRNATLVYLAQAVDVKPQRLSGPPLRAPSGGHAPPGLAIVTVVVDTLGRAEPGNISVVSISDSAWVKPVKDMLRNSQYSVGRVRGRAVRTEIGLSVPLQVTPVNPVELVTSARTLLASHHTDSAFTLLRLALDSSAHPTEAQRVYGLLVRGMAWKAAGRDSLAAADIASGLSGYKDLTNRGVDLAPFLMRLADSLSHAHRPPHPDPFQSLTVVGPVDQKPILLSHPPVKYPPEARQLNVSGTVTVEAVVDTSGHVQSGSAKIVQSANPIFNAEALRLVSAAVYHPGRRSGQAVTVTIQQPITFTNY